MANESDKMHQPNDIISSDKERTEEAARRGVISQRLHAMTMACLPGIQKSVNDAAQPGVPPITDLVILVVDGLSPIAPKEFRGNKSVMVSLYKRKDVERALGANYPVAAASVGAPPACGHLQFFVATDIGAVLQCTVCDLRMRPAKSRSVPS